MIPIAIVIIILSIWQLRYIYIYTYIADIKKNNKENKIKNWDIITCYTFLDEKISFDVDSGTT